MVFVIQAKRISCDSVFRKSSLWSPGQVGSPGRNCCTHITRPKVLGGAHSDWAAHWGHAEVWAGFLSHPATRPFPVPPPAGLEREMKGWKLDSSWFERSLTEKAKAAHKGKGNHAMSWGLEYPYGVFWSLVSPPNLSGTLSPSLAGRALALCELSKHRKISPLSTCVQHKPEHSPVPAPVKEITPAETSMVSSSVFCYPQGFQLASIPLYCQRLGAVRAWCSS